MLMLYFKPVQAPAITSGRLCQDLRPFSKDRLRPCRVGEELRLWTVGDKGVQTRLGVTSCTDVHQIKVAPDLPAYCDGRTISAADLGALINPGIADPKKHLRAGDHVPAWFNARFGSPIKYATSIVPYEGELIRWGALSEVGEFDHTKARA